jgi:hypothetical protein
MDVAPVEDKSNGNRALGRELVRFIITLLAVELFYFRDAVKPGMVLSAADWVLATESFRGKDFEPANRLLTDVACQMEPWMHLAGSEWRAGRVPLWNPYAGCGAPLLANAQSGVFNPIHFIYFLTDSPYAWVAMAIVKLFIAGIGAFLFARSLGLGRLGRWFAGLVFPFSGFTVVWLQYPMGGVAAWFPLLLWLVERLADRPGPSRAGWLALAMGAMLLGGHPETAAHILIVAGTYFIWRSWSVERARVPCQQSELERDGLAAASRRAPAGASQSLSPSQTQIPSRSNARALVKSLTWFAAASCVGFLIAAVQLVPLAEYLRYSQALIERRTESRGLWKNPMPDLLAVPALAAPYIYGSYLRGHPHVEKVIGVENFNEIAGGYTGLATLALLVPIGLVARRHPWIRFWFWADVLAIAAAYHLPGIEQLMRSIPILNITQNQRLLLVVALSHALLGGAGADAWAELCDPARRRFGRILAMLLACAAVLAALAAGGVWLAQGKIHEKAVEHFARQAEARGMSPEALRSKAETFAARTITFFPRYYLGILAYLAALGVVAGAAHRFRPTITRNVVLALVAVDLYWFGCGYNPAIPIRAYFPSSQVSEYLRWGGSGRWRYRYNQGRTLVLEEEFPPNVLGRYSVPDVRNYDAIELASHLGFFKTLWPPSGHRLTSNSWTTWDSVRQNIDKLAMANVRFLISTKEPNEPIPGVGLALRHRAVCVYELDRPTSWNPNVLVGAQLQPGLIRASANCESGGEYFFAESFMPGWKCWVDEEEVEVLPYRGTFLGVRLGPGSHEVRFEYQPLSFTIGAALSGLGIMSFLALVWALRPLEIVSRDVDGM